MSRTMTPRALAARHFAPVPLRSVELPRNLATDSTMKYEAFTWFYRTTNQEEKD